MFAELGISPGDLTAGFIVLIAVLMIFTGRLVPKRYYDEALSRCVEQERIAKIWQQTAESLLEQNTQLLTHDDVSLATLRAIRTSVAEDRRVDP